MKWLLVLSAFALGAWVRYPGLPGWLVAVPLVLAGVAYIFRRRG